jgi:fermentation-respiration switch protein FrsA (DUF1100 family)
VSYLLFRFHPPKPFYEFIFDDITGKYNVIFSEVLTDVPFDRLEVALIKTKTGGNVPIFYLKSPGATETIIYSHGNASDCGAMFLIYVMMASVLHVNIVAYDYTGYGASKLFNVKPTEQQTYFDIDIVYQWCIDNKIVENPSRQLILYGQSLGSGPSCYLAVQKPIAGLILHSPILSGLRVITSSRTLACFDIFPNLNRISHVKAPVFIIHGQDDKEVAFHHGFELYSAGRYT